MKIKFLAVLGLAAVAGLAGCKGATNANVATTNTNAVVVATATPIVKTTETATTDPNLKSNIESALKTKGFTGVTVDTTTTPTTLRGSVAKGKLAEVVQTVQTVNGGKPVKNEVQEK